MSQRMDAYVLHCNPIGVQNGGHQRRVAGAVPIEAIARDIYNRSGSLSVSSFSFSVVIALGVYAAITLKCLLSPFPTVSR